MVIVRPRRNFVLTSKALQRYRFLLNEMHSSQLQFQIVFSFCILLRFNKGLQNITQLAKIYIFNAFKSSSLFIKE